MVSGWKDIWLNPEFDSLKVGIKFLSSSCSEIKKKITHRLNGEIPTILWVAVQANGFLKDDTLEFIRNNYPERIEKILTNIEGENIWDRFNEQNQEEILRERANNIVMELREIISKEEII